jgi:hypothetical protein
MCHFEGHVQGDEYTPHSSVWTIVTTSTCPSKGCSLPRVHEIMTIGFLDESQNQNVCCVCSGGSMCIVEAQGSQSTVHAFLVTTLRSTTHVPRKGCSSDCRVC